MLSREEGIIETELEKQGSMIFTEAELHGYSEEHLLYDLRMLFETANRLLDDQSYSNDVVTENALFGTRWQ